MTVHTACFPSGRSHSNTYPKMVGVTGATTVNDCILDLSTCYEVDWSYPDCTAFDEPYVVKNPRLSKPAVEIPGPKCWSEDDLEHEVTDRAAEAIWLSVTDVLKNQPEVRKQHEADAIAHISTATWLHSRQKDCTRSLCSEFTSRCTSRWVVFGSILTLGWSDGSWQTCPPALFRGNLEASCSTTKTYKSGQFWRWLITDDLKQVK